MSRSHNGKGAVHRALVLASIVYARVISLGLRALTVVHRREYLALVVSFLLIILEAFVRIITLGLRKRSKHVSRQLLKSYSSTGVPLLLQSIKEPLPFPLFSTRTSIEIEKKVN